MASKNNKKFEAEITYFIAKTNTKMGQVKMLAIFQLFSNISDDTPLYVAGYPKRGQTKWNWLVSVGTISPRVLSGTDVGGDKSKARAYSELQKVVGNEDIYIHNSVPWIRKLEYGGYEPAESDRVSGGFSKQAPGGFMRINVLQWNQIVDTSVKTLPK